MPKLNAIQLLFLKHKLAIVLLSLITSLGLGFFAGNSLTKRGYELKLAKIEKEASELRAKAAEFRENSANSTVRVVTRYVDRVRVVKEKGETITKEVPVYITKEADDQCVLTNGFATIHDSAARNKLIELQGSPNDPLNKPLSQVTGVITDNYITCHEIRTQLIALQEWVNEQRNIYNTK